MNENSLSKFLAQATARLVEKGCGMGTIYRHIRRMECARYVTNIGILQFVAYEMHRLGALPSKKKITYHFRTNVPKNDWVGEKKKNVLHSLYKPINS